MKRTLTIGLLMICSEVLLCVFLAGWLRGQWRSEEQNLRTDLKLKFNTATQQKTDSLLKLKLKPESAPGNLNSPHSQKFRVLMPRRDGMSGKIPGGVTLRPRVVIHTNTWSNGHDSFSMQTRDTAMMNMLEGMQVMIGSILPDSVLNTLSMRDTGGVKRQFLQTLKADSRQMIFRWVSSKTIEQPATILLYGEGINRLFVAEISGYRPTLLRRILPQLLFAIALVLVTSLGFWLAMRSLRRERRLSQIKNNLVSNMSHELKTPVTTVKVALEALGEDAVINDPATVREYVGMANQELQRLELLINGTLHTSLLESGKLPMQFATMDLRDAAENVVSSMQLRFQKVSATATLQFSGDDFKIAADKLHVQGVLLNIIDNALKYGGTGVRLRINGKATAETAEISISDNGPGIPASYRKRVFEKFFRVPTGNLHLVKGYGLGLNYAAEVMRLHGGGISVESNDEGGSTFIIRFPKKAAA